MPMRKIQTIEYECNRCGYKWIERRNGRERRKEDLPSYCRASRIYGIRNAQKIQLLKRGSGMRGMSNAFTTTDPD
ncbi:MAG: hypothetical protein GEU26_13405 [Nitrososphaeraceae archaeon]|nr:hypothetical protein [Nitrososphaeraceae archaeon]